MEHFLSKKEKPDEVYIVTLDVSFILQYINKINKEVPVELMLLKFYKMKTDKEMNTLDTFKKYVKQKFKVNNDVELFKIVSKNTYLKIVMKIKHTLDALINRELGCEVYDAKFVSYELATSEKVIIKLEIKK